MKRVPSDSRDRVTEKCSHKHGDGFVAVEVIEQGQALPSNFRVRVRLRAQAKKRQINLPRCAQRGELSRRCRDETQDMPLDALPQTVIHDRDGSQSRAMTTSDQTISTIPYGLGVLCQVGYAPPLPMNRRSCSSNQLSVGVVLFTYADATRIATYG